MQIAIVSDIHDHVWNLEAALPQLARADAVLCCGDLCSPFVLAQLAEGIEVPLHVIFGNNDGDPYRLTLTAGGFDHVQLHGSFFRGDVLGVRVALTHYPEIAATLDSARLDLIAYGHDHTFFVGHRDGATVVNPGALMGYQPGKRANVPPTFVIYDVASASATRWQIQADGTLEEGDRSPHGTSP